MPKFTFLLKVRWYFDNWGDEHIKKNLLNASYRQSFNLQYGKKNWGEVTFFSLILYRRIYFVKIAYQINILASCHCQY